MDLKKSNGREENSEQKRDREREKKEGCGERGSQLAKEKAESGGYLPIQRRVVFDTPGPERTCHASNQTDSLPPPHREAHKNTSVFGPDELARKPWGMEEGFCGGEEWGRAVEGRECVGIGGGGSRGERGRRDVERGRKVEGVKK